MALPTFENVLLERTGTDQRIGVLTLNRPEKMNALSQELIYDFRDALEYFETDDDVRVLIVKGAAARSRPATTSRQQAATALTPFTARFAPLTTTATA